MSLSHWLINLNTIRNRPGLILAVLAIFLASGCGHGEGPARAPKAVEVLATTPITDEVTDYQDFTGRLSAIKTVNIRARVSGYVTDAPFKEGDLVKQGDVLFEIDPRPYKYTYEMNKAQVALNEANLKLAQQHDVRAESLEKTASIAQAEVDQVRAQVAQAVASLNLAKANLETAQLNFDWTKVRAPLSGRISQRLIDPGNLITADSTILTTLVAEDPMYVYFDVDERTFLNLTGSASTKLSAAMYEREFPLLMRLANEDEFLHKGVVNFIDNQVNSGTGTIRMRGVFRNPQGFLKAGLFARIRLPIGTPYQAILIPDEALMSDQGRKYVYVLNDKDEVVHRPVQLGQAIQDLRVIKQGLKEGERLVVTGMQRVRRGMKVTVKMQPPPQRPESSLGRILSFNRPGAGAAPKRALGAQ